MKYWAGRQLPSWLGPVFLLLAASATALAQKPEIVIQSGHSGGVHTAVFNCDGRWLATASQDGVILWDTRTGLQLRRLPSMAPLAFSPTDAKFLAANMGDEIIIWNVETGEAAQRLSVRDPKDGDDWDELYNNKSIAFSADGRLLAVGGGADDSMAIISASARLGRVKIWEVATGRLLHRLVLPAVADDWSYFDAVAFSRDGKILATGGGTATEVPGRNGGHFTIAHRNEIRLWSVTTGRLLRVLDRFRSQNITLAFSTDGRTLAAGLRGYDDMGSMLGVISPEYDGNGELTAGIKLLDVATSRQIRRFSGVSMSPAGNLLAIPSTDVHTPAKLTEVFGGRKLPDLAIEKDWISSVVLSPDGRVVASSYHSGRTRLLDAESGKELQVLVGRSLAVTSISFSPDGRALANGTNAVAYNSHGNRIKKGVEGEGGKIWNVSTGRELRNLGGDEWIQELAYSPAGGTLVTRDLEVQLRDAVTGEVLHTLLGPAQADGREIIDGVAFSPDGKTLAGTADGQVFLWDVESGQELFRLTGLQYDIEFVGFGPDGKIYVLDSSLNFDGLRLSVWSATAGELLDIKKIGVGAIDKAVLSPDGRTLAVLFDFLYGGERPLKLYDTVTGKEKNAFAPESIFSDLAFSPKGDVLVGCDRRGIKVWRAADGQLLRTVPAYGSNAVALSPDGKLLATGDADTSVRLWDIEEGRELAALVTTDRDDWLVVTPDGLFDGTPEAWNRILWRFSTGIDDLLPVEAFFNEFFYPGLLADILSGKRPRAAQSIAVKDRRQPELELVPASPRAETSEVDSREMRLRLKMRERSSDVGHPRGSGVRDVRLFRNGSLVRAWRGDVLDAKDDADCTGDGTGGVVCETSVTLVAGENNFTAYAFNQDNVKSVDVRLTVKGAQSLARQSTAYVIVIGLNEYALNSYNLLYAEPDALDFGAEFVKQQEGLKRYEKVHLIPLLNGDGTRANILSVIARLAGQEEPLPAADVSPRLRQAWEGLGRANPEDSVVVFYAGHGVATEDGRFYLLPHDVKQPGESVRLDASSLRRAISDEELEEAFATVDARHIVLILDACHAGQFLETGDTRRGPINARGLGQLAFEKGMYVLAAAQGRQAAVEPTELKHGLLTYVLIEEGLRKGEADQEPEFGRILLGEWFDYAVERVPRVQAARMGACRDVKRDCAFVDGEETIKDITRRSLQRPRAYYRRESEARSLVVGQAAPRPGTPTRNDDGGAAMGLASHAPSPPQLSDADAEKAYKLAARLEPAEAYMHLASFYYERERYAESVDAYRQAVRAGARPSGNRLRNFHLHLNAGFAYLRLRLNEEALNAFEQALLIEPESAVARLYVGATYTIMGQADEAAASFQQATRISPDWATPYERLALLYYSLGRFEDAVNAYTEVIRRQPGDYTVLRARAWMALFCRRGEMAASDAHAFLAARGWNDDSSLYMALVAYFGHRQAGQTRQAAMVLAEAVRKADANAWPYAALRYLRHEITESAFLAQATDVDKMTEARAYAGLIHAMSGERDAALAHLRWVRERGNRSFLEYSLALAELERLELSTAKPK